MNKTLYKTIRVFTGILMILGLQLNTWDTMLWAKKPQVPYDSKYPEPPKHKHKYYIITGA